MLNVLYAGSPDASAKTLELLLNDSASLNETAAHCAGAAVAQAYRIVGVLTNPPSAQGRHKELIPTDVAQCAMKWNEAHAGSAENQIALFTPEHLDAACREQIEKVHADVVVCFAYGHIFGPKFLALFKFGGINLHPSLLPKYRGCTPVNAALLNCDSETGFSIQKMALAADEGDLLVQQTISLTGKETAETLLNDAAVKGAASLTQILRATAEHNELPPATPQTGVASYCPLIKKEDGAINWKNPAQKIDAQIRAYTPWPGCFTTANGVQLRVLQAYAASAEENNNSAEKASAVPGTVIAFDKPHGILIQCGEGVLVVQELQWQAKKAMDYKAFMNGAHDFIGTVLE